MVKIKCKKCGTELGPQKAGLPCPVCGDTGREISAPIQDTLKLEQVLTARSQATVTLARKHYQVEPGLTKVIRFSGSADIEGTASEPIKLLEVNENTFPSGVMPLQFGAAPARGIQFPSVIVEVTPAEYEQIKVQELTLPKGWVIGEEVPKPDVSNGEG